MRGKGAKKNDENARNEVRLFYKRRCVVCGRKTNTVHEHKRRGAGGIVSLSNSLTCCSVVDGGMCHELLQARQITPLVGSEPLVEGQDVRRITGFRMNAATHRLVFSHRAVPGHIEIEE